MLVSEVMHSGVITANINDSVRKVAELMRKEDIGAVPIMEDNRLVGFVTDRDIVIGVVADGFSSEGLISNVMNEHVISIRVDKTMEEAAKMMEENQISRLLVVDENERPLGIIGLQDLFQNLTDEFNAEILSQIKQ